MRRRVEPPRARGPKGWRRPDDRILDELCVTIAASGVDASDVEVTVEDGEVWLDGGVAHPADRAALHDLAQRVLGVTAVHAELRVHGAGPARGEPAVRRGDADEEHVEPDPETRH